MRDGAVGEWLGLGLNPYERRLNGRLIEALAAGFRRWRRTAAPCTPPAGEGGGPLPDLLRFLYHEIDREGQHLAALRKRHAEFTRRHGRSATEAERRQHVLD